MSNMQMMSMMPSVMSDCLAERIFMRDILRRTHARHSLGLKLICTVVKKWSNVTIAVARSPTNLNTM